MLSDQPELLAVFLDELRESLKGLEAQSVALARVDDLREAVQAALAACTALSDELQRSIMAVRRVTVRQLLQKASRLVHDIAQAAGKDIAVELQGEGVEVVDKSRLDLLDGSLTHPLRYCADHGIESPERRSAMGKPPQGTIAVSAATSEGWFTLTISDALDRLLARAGHA